MSLLQLWATVFERGLAINVDLMTDDQAHQEATSPANVGGLSDAGEAYTRSIV